MDSYWRLYLDPECFRWWSVSEAGSVLIHEVHHLLRDHSSRGELLDRTSFDRLRFNVAGDIEINDDLTNLELPPGGCTPERFGVPAGELAESYYGILASTKVPLRADCGSAADGCPRAWEIGPSEDAIGAAEGALIRDHIARAIRSAPGNVPGGLVRWAHSLLTPTVDWRRVLRGLVRAGIAQVSGAVDYTYSRPSRRSNPVRPSVVMPAMSRPVARVAIVVDTSASMDEVALAVALAEASGVIAEGAAAREPVAVIACDHDVQRTRRVMTAAGLELVGGGGTDMGKGIEAAARLRPRPQLVVVLTDGYTPWPKNAPPGVAVVVALIGECTSAPPWARLVRVPLN